MRTPRSLAKAISPDEKPPSGPINSPTDAPAEILSFDQGWVSPPPKAPIYTASHVVTRRSTTSANAAGCSISGKRLRPHCFTAARTNRCHRSILDADLVRATPVHFRQAISQKRPLQSPSLGQRQIADLSTAPERVLVDGAFPDINAVLNNLS